MNPNISEDDTRVLEKGEEVESPRKRICTGHTTRRSWSLMDKKTDYEVLQEMGVGLLESDDGESNCETVTSVPHQRPAAKRKRDIENVNPNANRCGTSSFSPQSPRSKIKPGPSKTPRSPRSLEKLKPLQETDQQLLETTLQMEYLIDEETPMGQFVSAEYKPSGPGFASCSTERKKRTKCISLSQEGDVVPVQRHKLDSEDTDSFTVLSDEMMLSVFSWLPKRTLVHCMLVCKRWYRMACDEMLWQRLDLGNKTLNRGALGKILARKPLVVRLASSEIGEWQPTSLPAPSKIQYLDLSMATVDRVTLESLLAVCRSLKKLSMENLKLCDSTCCLIGKCRKMETLNLTMAQGLTWAGVKMILQGCTNLQALNMSWCNLDGPALSGVVGSLPARLKRLNLAGARLLKDTQVAELCAQCPDLLELDLSDCSRISTQALDSLIRLDKLEHLGLSRCYYLPVANLVSLTKMSSLQYLEMWGMFQNPSLNALKSSLPNVKINQFKFSAIARPTVEPRRTSIWGLKTRD